jgi:hypothetical protein
VVKLVTEGDLVGGYYNSTNSVERNKMICVYSKKKFLNPVVALINI